MIDSEFHVEINGVKYRLAEDAESEHYIQREEHLRAPNTQLVQGKPGEFNLRSDLLVWSWTDWSGGEGQVKYDPQQPNRALILENVDPFSSPGQLKLGYKTFLAKNSGGTTFTLTSTPTGRLAKVQKELWLQDVGDLYEWDDTNDDRFYAGTADGVGYQVTGAPDGLWTVSYGPSDALYRLNTAKTDTLINNQMGGNGSPNPSGLVVLGDYCYIYDAISDKIWEVLKNTVNTTTAETAIYDSEDLDQDVNTNALDPNGSVIVAAENRVYVMSARDAQTTIHEIVPSSSANAGYGRIFATLKGLRGEGMWWQGGFLYVLVSTGPRTAPQDRQIIYIDPNGAYGTLGTVRGAEDGVSVPQILGAYAFDTASFTSSAFALPAPWSGRTEAQSKLGLFEIDAVTGGIAQTAWFGSVLANSEGYNHLSHVFYKGKHFLVVEPKSSGATQWVAVADTQVPSNDDGTAVSPIFNLGLAGEKVLESIEVRCQPLPTGSSIEVFYQLDSSGSWTSLGTIAAGSTGGTLSVDNTPTAKTFRGMQVKVELNSPADGNQVVLDEVNVYASTDIATRRWLLLLDATDETSPRGHTGATLIQNISDIGENTPVTFKDGYTNRTRGVSTEVDVIVEDKTFVLSQPGEGVIQVSLREVL